MIRTRKRFQGGSLKKVGRQWIAQWREDGHRRKARWPISGMSKSEAEGKLAGILVALDAGRTIGKPKPTFAEFVEYTYLPFYGGKWKISTAGDNEGRLKFHLSSVYASRTVDSFSRDEFQQLLNQKAAEYSYSVVAHIRWTLRQIFRMVVEEGYAENATLRTGGCILRWATRSYRRMAQESPFHGTNSLGVPERKADNAGGEG